jgi:hypothetical protein
MRNIREISENIGNLLRRKKASFSTRPIRSLGFFRSYDGYDCDDACKGVHQQE